MSTPAPEPVFKQSTDDPIYDEGQGVCVDRLVHVNTPINQAQIDAWHAREAQEAADRRMCGGPDPGGNRMSPAEWDHLMNPGKQITKDLDLLRKNPGASVGVLGGSAVRETFGDGQSLEDMRRDMRLGADAWNLTRVGAGTGGAANGVSSPSSGQSRKDINQGIKDGQTGTPLRSDAP